MKKKTASVLLAFAVIISLCACNSSQRSRDSSDSSTQSETEQVITEAKESTGEDTERLLEDAAPASENLNEYSVTEAELDRLVELYTEKLNETTEAVVADSGQTAADFYAAGDSRFQTDDFEFTNYLRISISAGDDMDNALTSIQEQLEASGVPVTIMDEALLYSLSDWKTETGIDNDRFTEFATEMFTDFDAFQAAYLQPAFDEIVGR